MFKLMFNKKMLFGKLNINSGIKRLMLVNCVSVATMRLMVRSWTVVLQEGKPPPKNMLKRSSGVTSASKPRWKSKPPPWDWLGLLGSSPPVTSYCCRFAGLLRTAYAFPISEGKKATNTQQVRGNDTTWSPRRKNNRFILLSVVKWRSGVQFILPLNFPLG